MSRTKTGGSVRSAGSAGSALFTWPNESYQIAMQTKIFTLIRLQQLPPLDTEATIRLPSYKIFRQGAKMKKIGQWQRVLA